MEQEEAPTPVEETYYYYYTENEEAPMGGEVDQNVPTPVEGPPNQDDKEEKEEEPSTAAPAPIQTTPVPISSKESNTQVTRETSNHVPWAQQIAIMMAALVILLVGMLVFGIHHQRKRRRRQSMEGASNDPLM